jgi:hypothetical protein
LYTGISFITKKFLLKINDANDLSGGQNSTDNASPSLYCLVASSLDPDDLMLLEQNIEL